MRAGKAVIAGVLVQLVGISNEHARAQSPAAFYSGMRVSTIPFSPFPQAEFFVSNGRCLTTKVPGSQPVLVWIVSLYWSNGDIGVDFPRPPGSTYPHINFKSTDRSEPYLTYFDTHGIKVWLQVEPGDANMLDLIDLVLSRYRHHPCVVGFGMDGEWFNTTQVSNGRAVTDAEALNWDARIKTYNPAYRLFLKHYIQSKMPPTVRGDLLFINDSQGFSSLNSMVNSFKSWGNKFKPAEVGFQYGYPDDRIWWSTYSDPSGTVAAALHANVPNASTFLWVDFTIQEILPIASPPVITAQPQPRSTLLGRSVAFTVSVSGAGVLAYQWQKNGADLSEGDHYAGTQSATLTVSDVNSADTGSYRCIISSACGNVTSDEAALTLRIPGDLDADRDVDTDDFDLLHACITGPGSGPPAGSCTNADIDSDNDVDQGDFGLFQRCLSGSFITGDLGCARLGP